MGYSLPGGLERGYMERYLLKAYPQLKDLWKGFKAKLVKKWDNLVDREGMGAPTEAFAELTANYCMYFFDKGGNDLVKTYLIRELNLF